MTFDQANSLRILRGIFSYGLIAILAKSCQFFTIIYLELELPQVDFVDYGLKYALQTGIVVFTLFGINEGMISKFVRVDQKKVLLGNALKIVFIGQIIILIWAIVFLSSSEYLFPLINGLILGNLLMTSCVYKLNQEHSKARFYLYSPQFLFHFVVLICVHLKIEADLFFVSSLALIIFMVLFQTKRAFLCIQTKITYNTFKDLAVESSSYYSMAIIGWVFGYGFSWIIKLLYDDSDVARYIYLYTFSGVILLVTNSFFNMWNPAYLNSSKRVPVKAQNLFYDLVAIAITLISIVIALLLYYLKPDFEAQLIHLGILLASFVFYVPIWRARLYFQELQKGWVLMRFTFLSSIGSFLLFLCLQSFLGPISVYLFFVSNSIALCFFVAREISRENDYQIELRNSFLLGSATILIIYLLQFNVVFTLFGTAVLFLLFISNSYRLKNLW